MSTSVTEYLYLIVNSIIKPLDEHSSAITAIATIVLAILTLLYIREIRHERKYQRRINHTERLKEKVIKPWIEELERIRLPSKASGVHIFSSCFRARNRGFAYGDKVSYYRGDKLKVEDEILFEDLKNHIDSNFFRSYEEFKNNVKTFWNKINELEDSVKAYLDDRISMLEWNKVYQNLDDILKDGGFFDLDQTLCFFLDSLLVNFTNNVKLSTVERRDGFVRALFYSYSDEGIDGKYCSEYCEYIDKEIDEEKEMLIIDTLKYFLQDLSIRFKKDISEIHFLLDEIKEDRDRILRKLQEIKEIVVFQGDCKYID